MTPSSTGAAALFRAALAAERPAFVAAACASLLANLVALAGSLYSMQVYDRVIPTQALSTLTVLTVGALGAGAFELLVKMARSRILDASVRQMDAGLSSRIFERLLNIRLDQFPSGAGTVSAQVRSYESIRSFAASATLYAVVDAPFALLFLAVMGLLAGVELCLVPAAFFVIAMSVGLMYRRRIAKHAALASAAGNQRSALLVETVEGAEAVKAASAQAERLARWNALSGESIVSDLSIRQASESASYFAAFFQQTSYIAMIGVGAYIAATSTQLTTGGLIACSILSGRVLAPIGMLPGMIVQWAHARIALANLERIFALEQDNHGIDQPLQPHRLNGALRVEKVSFSYPGRPPSVEVEKLVIGAGEKVAILGPIGAGKTTLLKLMAGLYKPTQGRVLVDDLEMQQIARAHLARLVGYLGQDSRLHGGTLRDNLVIGRTDIDDDAVLGACRDTGLSALVAAHPKGLDLPIAEGGSGVSGGQRALIALTRLVLAKPSVWMLDEPTSAMDDASERTAITVLRRAIEPGQTLVLVTHKPQMLQLVDRIVVLTDTGIVLDGPKAAVLQALAPQPVRTLQPVPAPVAMPVREVA